jgi:hypothetical protein
MRSAVDTSPLVGRASEGFVIAAPAAGCRHGATAARLPGLPAIPASPAIHAATAWFTWTSVLACGKCRPPGTAVHGAPGVRGAGVVLGVGT